MYADLALENRALKDLIEKKALGPAEKREAVTHMKTTHRLSIQRGCHGVGLSRSAYYRSLVPSAEKDSDVIQALNTVPDRHPRWGFWKSFTSLRQGRHRWNHKRVYRVYCDLGLNQKRRATRRIPQRFRQPLNVPGAPSQSWSADFMSDAFYGGKRFRTFNVIDDFNRESSAIEIDTSITGLRLIRVLDDAPRAELAGSITRRQWPGVPQWSLCGLGGIGRHDDPLHRARRTESELSNVNRNSRSYCLI